MVLIEEFTGRTEAADLFDGRGGGLFACAEEFGGMVFFQGMTLVVRAYFAVFPADLPVLFCIFYRIFAGIYHENEVCDDC
jgi:hypothetical protein